MYNIVMDIFLFLTATIITLLFFIWNEIDGDKDLIKYINNEHLVLEIVFPENNIMLSL